MSEEEKQLPQEEGANSAENNQEVNTPEDTQQEPPKETQQPVEKKEEEQQPPQQDYSKVTEIEEATDILKGKGIDYNELQAEWEEKGQLSEESYKKLEEAGIPREVADNYIEGRKAIVEKAWDDIASVVGGREKMNTIIEWARNNLSQAEKESIDKVTDPTLIKIILRDLSNSMNDKEGYLPQPIQGNGGEDSGNYFKSMAEVEEAINDPKYAKDEVYRNEIARKISASREAGVLELK